MYVCVTWLTHKCDTYDIMIKWHRFVGLHVAACVAVCCSVLQCGAVWDYSRKRVNDVIPIHTYVCHANTYVRATWCHTNTYVRVTRLQNDTVWLSVFMGLLVSMCRSVLQGVAVCCSVLQCVAVCKFLSTRWKNDTWRLLGFVSLYTHSLYIHTSIYHVTYVYRLYIYVTWRVCVDPTNMWRVYIDSIYCKTLQHTEPIYTHVTSHTCDVTYVYGLCICMCLVCI